MSIEIHALRYLGLYEEPFGSYQVAHESTPGDFLALPYQENSLQWQQGRAQLNPNLGKMRNDGHDKQVLGPRACTLAASIPLHSHGLDLDGDIAPPTTSTWALMRLLKAVMGGSISTGNPGSQTTVQAGTTTTVVNVTAGHGTRFQAGGVIAGPTVSGSPLLEVREVLSVAVDAVTVKQAFSAVPITGQPVRGGVTFYMTEDPNTSLQALIEGREAQDAVALRGLQGGFSLQLPVGEIGTIGISWAGASWLRLNSGVTIPSYLNTSVMALAPLELTVPTVGATTRVLVDEGSMEITPGIVYGPQKSGSATETIRRMRRQPTRPLAQGNWVTPYEDETWYTARDNREDRAVFAQAGALAGSIAYFSFPTVQITDVQPAVSETGIAGQQVSWQARHDIAIGGATELGYSAMRISFV